jgi:hypothetical protein
MSAAKPLSGLRRRPMPGMPSQPVPRPAPPSRSPEPGAEVVVAERDQAAEELAVLRQRPSRSTGAHGRWAAEDYSATRLANFRLPVDLHDRFRRLVAEVEQQHPRLRRPSLTEVIIALLEEGPSTPDEVAELIRRKRAAEHAEGSTR